MLLWDEMGNRKQLESNGHVMGTAGLKKALRVLVAVAGRGGAGCEGAAAAEKSCALKQECPGLACVGPQYF